MIKKLIGAFLVAGLMTGAVYGAAAAIDVTSDEVGAGGVDVLSCTSAVDVSYTVEYFDDTMNGGFFKVDDVTVSGLDDCVGQDLTVQLTQTDGAALGDFETQPITAASEDVDFGTDQNLDAEDLADIHVAVVGTN